MDRDTQTILCPTCGRKMFDIYEGYTMVISKKCSKCKKLVVYNPRYGVVVKKVPQRAFSGGKRFY